MSDKTFTFYVLTDQLQGFIAIHYGSNDGKMGSGEPKIGSGLAT